MILVRGETVLQGVIDRLSETGKFYGLEMNVEKKLIRTSGLTPQYKTSGHPPHTEHQGTNPIQNIRAPTPYRTSGHTPHTEHQGTHPIHNIRAPTPYRTLGHPPHT